MTNFLFTAATFVLVMGALGLVRILRGPGDVERILSLQLIGSGGVAVLLLLTAATSRFPRAITRTNRTTNEIHHGYYDGCSGVRRRVLFYGRHHRVVTLS